MGILDRTPKSLARAHSKGEYHLHGIAGYEPHELPYETRSICPNCYLEDGSVTIVDATVHETGRGVVMTKSCPEHGHFEEVVWSDAALYERSMERWYRSVGILNPKADSVKGCPLRVRAGYPTVCANSIR